LVNTSAFYFLKSYDRKTNGHDKPESRKSNSNRDRVIPARHLVRVIFPTNAIPKFNFAIFIAHSKAVIPNIKSEFELKNLFLEIFVERKYCSLNSDSARAC